MEESIKRNPATDLGGSTFLCFSDSFVSAAEMLCGLNGGAAALTADSCKVFRGRHALKFACCASDSEERCLGMVVFLASLFSALIL